MRTTFKCNGIDITVDYDGIIHGISADTQQDSAVIRKLDLLIESQSTFAAAMLASDQRHDEHRNMLFAAQESLDKLLERRDPLAPVSNERAHISLGEYQGQQDEHEPYFGTDPLSDPAALALIAGELEYDRPMGYQRVCNRIGDRMLTERRTKALLQQGVAEGNFKYIDNGPGAQGYIKVRRAQA